MSSPNCPSTKAVVGWGEVQSCLFVLGLFRIVLQVIEREKQLSVIMQRKSMGGKERIRRMETEREGEESQSCCCCWGHWATVITMLRQAAAASSWESMQGQSSPRLNAKAVYNAGLRTKSKVTRQKEKCRLPVCLLGPTVVGTVDTYCHCLSLPLLVCLPGAHARQNKIAYICR